MIQDNPAPAEHEIHPLLQNRWSVVSFSSKPVDQALVDQVLEAGRWAPSSFNEQPWQYVVGHKGDATFEKLASCLVEGNAYAKEAGVLMLSVAKTFFDRNQKPNRHYMHDTGAASISMHIQATHMGLRFHQMAGFEVEKARELFGIGEEYEPAAMIALAYPHEDTVLKERKRKPFEDLLWKI